GSQGGRRPRPAGDAGHRDAAAERHREPPRRVHDGGRALRKRPGGRAVGADQRAGRSKGLMEAAYRHPWRPARYWIAGLIGAGVLLVIVASSILAILFRQVPARGTIFGLPAVVLVVAATVFGVRALHDHDLASRMRDLYRAGVLLGVGLLLWLLVIDVFTFTQAAGPGVAAVCALACVPTTTVGLLVVRRLD